ncbi:unnamed protein product [Fraxinus pennsylvanica]|uniref:Uncharacterized protein n=1 Tax=Fraxinus pennsylvanica TaxID=56036 RepID=A0AAD1ZWK7_9LAMI|nr:unnamed protein product [Fraxinus pennsylvanica]
MLVAAKLFVVACAASSGEHCHNTDLTRSVVRSVMLEMGGAWEEGEGGEEEGGAEEKKLICRVSFCIGSELEKKRKERAQATYERKKQLTKLRIKAEKVAEEKLGGQLDIIAPIKY